MACLRKFYPNGLDQEVNAIEFQFRGISHTISFDRSDFEQARPTKPKSFRQRLTAADQRLLADMQISL
jgi:hypothetical protein